MTKCNLLWKKYNEKFIFQIQKPGKRFDKDDIWEIKRWER
jgi:hypothetical protein